MCSNGCTDQFGWSPRRASRSPVLPVKRIGEFIMSNATIKASAALATSPVDADDFDRVPTVDTLRAAFAAANGAGSTAAVATATLATLTLKFYAHTADGMARTLDGATVLPESDRKEVARIVTLAVTGRTELPNKSNGLTISPASISLGQYISRYGTVAVNADYGVAYLESVDAAKEAYKGISEGTSAAKTAAADKALTVWMSGLIESERKALAIAIDVLQSESASAHRAPFARLIK